MTALRVVFGGLVFGAALLLFAVEPMAAKQLLPVLGGASAVWITCLVFFQTALLVGYLYAHWMARGARMRIHAALLALAVLLLIGRWAMLPGSLGSLGFGAAAAWDALHPVRTIFAFLTGTIGLPFVLLAATSPLLQVWWVRVFGGRVPYALFAVSNAGSLLGLALYPVVIEPHMTLNMQSRTWAICFCAYALVCGWLGLFVRRSPAVPAAVEEDEALENTKHAERVSAGRRMLWFALPMVAALQLSAVTSHLTQDVAAVPMLWILPLGVYLLTFILAFEAPGIYRRAFVVRTMAVMVGSLGYALSRVDATLPIGMAIAFYMLEVFIACWFCHAEAYKLRPRTAGQSTVFYLLVAAGGAAGTFFVAVVSPMVFRSNYDLAISFLATAAVAAVVTWRDGWGQRLLWVTGTGLLAFLVVALHIEFARQTVMRARNFYGALRVTQTDMDRSSLDESESSKVPGSNEVGTGPVRTLMNGRIRHGTQMLDADRRRVPTTYYGKDSGINVALKNCCDGRPKRVGVIGLGTGTLAAYGEAGDQFRFYEINPLVEPIARNLFTYLNDSPAEISVAEGDGRALLQREPPHGFDVLVVDAFSGDAIPLHLLTHEAMVMYRSQIAPSGVIAFHVSNSYLDLAPEIELLAESVGMKAGWVESGADPGVGEYRASWVLVSASDAFWEVPVVANASARIIPPPGLRVWTDEYSSLLPILRWRQ